MVLWRSHPQQRITFHELLAPSLGEADGAFIPSNLVLRQHLGSQRCRRVTGMPLGKGEHTSTLLSCQARGSHHLCATAKDSDLAGTSTVQEGIPIVSRAASRQEGAKLLQHIGVLHRGAPSIPLGGLAGKPSLQLPKIPALKGRAQPRLLFNCSKQ